MRFRDIVEKLDKTYKVHRVFTSDAENIVSVRFWDPNEKCDNLSVLYIGYDKQDSSLPPNAILAMDEESLSKAGNSFRGFVLEKTAQDDGKIKSPQNVLQKRRLLTRKKGWRFPILL